MSLKKALAIAAVSAVCLFSASSANAQWPFGGFGGPGFSIGISGPGVGFYITSGVPYYSGYRGYPYYLNGYRMYNGYWFPPAAFSTRAVPRIYPGASAHVQWCMQTYRSYRVSDNTFQPYVGPRQPCVSPYGW